MSVSTGALIIDLQGTTLTPLEAELLAHPVVGGVILFTRNYESREQCLALCAAIRAATTRPRLILVDQEGGRVQRFIPEFTRLAPVATLGEAYDRDPVEGLNAVNQHATTMATELLSLGIDVSLAPVLDLNKGISTVIGNRAFHRDPALVSRLATAYARAMQSVGMAAVGKHFPGHGGVSLDSHVASPIDTRTLETLEQDDLIPFLALIKAGIAGMMASHLIFPAIDDKPVGFSRRWITEILRERYQYRGVILTDDLNMHGASVVGDCTTRVMESREAGCDFALLCNNREGVIHALDHLPEAKHQVSEACWRALREKYTHRQMAPQN